MLTEKRVYKFAFLMLATFFILNSSASQQEVEES